jgi:predicted GNAT family acetyltransferase
MISWLVGEETAAYVHLATDAVAKGLSQVHAPETSVSAQHGNVQFAAGLRFAGLPAALAVLRAEASSGGENVVLLSLVVAPQLRGLGLARELLKWLRRELCDLGWTTLSLSYPLNHACTQAMEKLTRSSSGWIHRPGLQIMQLDRSGAADLVERLTPLVKHAQRSGRLKVKMWSDVEASTLRGLGIALGAPLWAHPREDLGQEDPLQTLDPACSAVLLNRGQEAGWITSHRVGQRLFRVSQWWVKPELQGRGAALVLLRHAVHGALQSRQDYAYGTFGMEAGNAVALNLCQRKLESFACSVNKQRRASIPLKCHPA